jgi:DNA-binding response OmpR family regulator
MLSGGSGLKLVKTVRESSKVPLLLLGAASETEDRIAGLQIAADDYPAKPFSPRELGARIHAILRRTRDTPKDGSEIKVGDARSLGPPKTGEPCRNTSCANGR